MSMFDRIELLRKDRGISQGKLEKELGFSNGSISKWKQSTPNPERLKKLAEYFGVSFDYLITGEEKEVEIFSSENASLLAKVTKNKDAVRMLEYYMRLTDSDKKEIEMMVAYKANKKE